MRIRWRGLELPSRVICDEEVSTDRYGRFIVEPFEHGFGTTIGNSLRRILLSSIEGAAVTTVKIAGVSHEFVAMDGVIEDVTDIILNIKGIELALEGDEPKTMKIRKESAGAVTAADIEADPAITIVNTDHHIATVTEKIPFHVDFTVGSGRGFIAAAENRAPDQELGVIPLDSVYSPVVRVRYRTEEMRVGQKTNYDRLIMEIWTRGTIKPEDALVEAGSILRKHLNPFVLYHELGEETVSEAPPEPQQDTPMDSEKQRLLEKSTSELNLSVRASNCLEQARITTIGELVQRTDADLLRVRSFGRTSLHEVKRKLADMGLSLGMKPDMLADQGDPVVSFSSSAPTPPSAIAGEGGMSQPPGFGGESQPGSGSEFPVVGGDDNNNDDNDQGPMQAFTMGD